MLASTIPVELSEACMTLYLLFCNTQVNLSYLELIEIVSEDVFRVSAFLKEAGYESYIERKAG